MKVGDLVQAQNKGIGIITSIEDDLCTVRHPGLYDYEYVKIPINQLSLLRTNKPAEETQKMKLNDKVRITDPTDSLYNAIGTVIKINLLGDYDIQLQRVTHVGGVLVTDCLTTQRYFPNQLEIVKDKTMLTCSSIKINSVHTAKISYLEANDIYLPLNFMKTLTSPTVTKEVLKSYYDQLPYSSLTFETFTIIILKYMWFYWQIKDVLFDSHIKYHFEYTLTDNPKFDEENPDNVNL